MVNEFLQILNNDDDKANLQPKESQIKSQLLDPAWRAVLTNAFHLHYPGPDGTYKNAEPLRPLWVALNVLREAGAGLVKAKKSDGSEHLKLVQGAMPADEWERVRASLARDKDKLMWLFTLSVMGGVDEEEIARQQEIAARLFEEAAIQLEGRDRTAMETAAKQLRLNAKQMRLNLTG
jgi:hypothetical protein